MLKHVAHRGPDEQNTFIKHESGVYLGFARLSMVDIEKSSQPFFDRINNYVIMFNGEIYNYLELRDQLVRKGVVFSTESDSEVLLRAYLYYGEKCVDYFEGMWAFAIYDCRTCRSNNPGRDVSLKLMGKLKLF